MFCTISIFVLVASAARADVLSSRNATSIPPEDRNTTFDGGFDRPHKGQHSLPVPLLADTFYRALAHFAVSDFDVHAADCQRHTQMYVEHLKNNTRWAVKMYDSWSKYPNGLLAGTTHQMGVYEECISVHRPVQGQYCMTAIKLSATAGTNFDLTKRDKPDDLDHAWNEMLGFIDYGDQYPRDEVNIGVCIPESCTARNLEVSLQKKLDTVFSPHRVQTRVKVEPIMCSTNKNMLPYSTGYYVTSIIIVLVIIICCVATVFHLSVITWGQETGKKSNVPEFIYWFSIIYNGRSLIKYDRTNDLNIFNGAKTLIMFLMLWGHKYLYYVRQPITYPERTEKVYEIGPSVYLTSMNLVDFFFFIAGLLIYTMVKPQLIKRGSGLIQVPMIVFYKYLRFLPAYGVIMLLTTFFIPYMHNGPFWAFSTLPEANNCKNYWWANLLAISNFIDTEKQCLVAGWYVSCLLQFIVISVFVVYVCVKKPKLGVSLIVALLIVSLVIPFVLTYTTRSYGMVRVLLPFLHNPSSSYEYQNLYRPFYNRGIPFYTGLLTGVVVEELKRREVKLSKPVVYIWTIIFFYICYWIQNYATVFYQRHRSYDVIEQSAYAVLSHCTWSFGLLWITVCHFTSGYGPIGKVFDNRFASLLGRLTYAVYLVNMPVMLTITGRQTAAVATDTDIWLDIWIVGVVRTYITGLALYLLVEAPFNTIIKTIFFGSKSGCQEDDKVCAGKGNSSRVENPLDVLRV